MSKVDDIRHRLGELESEQQQLAGELQAAEAAAGQAVADGKDAEPVITRRQQLANKMDAVLAALNILRGREAEEQQRQDAADQRKYTKEARAAVAKAHDTAGELDAAAAALFEVTQRLQGEITAVRLAVRKVKDEKVVREQLQLGKVETIANLVDGWRQHYDLVK